MSAISSLPFLFLISFVPLVAFGTISCKADLSVEGSQSSSNNNVVDRSQIGSANTHHSFGPSAPPNVNCRN